MFNVITWHSPHGFDESQKQNDLMRETEALGAELKQIQEEVDMRHAEVSVGSFFFVTVTTFPQELVKITLIFVNTSTFVDI